ncbi:MAG: hypothetical protein ABI549_13300 [Flavobacterium sp.]|uniref:hypothetical protein n=1 Tax=Flavobacterium sp. TaxID=239 RepID=UPI00326726D7
MITDAELQELECLLIAKYREKQFDPIIHDQETNLVYIKDNGFVDLLKLYFPERFRIDNSDNVVMSLDIFRILQSRYFRENKTVVLVQK